VKLPQPVCVTIVTEFSNFLFKNLEGYSGSVAEFYGFEDLRNLRVISNFNAF
jgi:hypothetical protein